MYNAIDFVHDYGDQAYWEAILMCCTSIILSDKEGYIHFWNEALKLEPIYRGIRPNRACKSRIIVLKEKGLYLPDWALLE